MRIGRFTTRDSYTGSASDPLSLNLYEATQDPYYSNQYQKFLNTQDINSATELFCNNFEQAGIPHLDERQTAAQSILNNYTGG